MVTYIFFLNFFFLHSYENNEVGFVKFQHQILSKIDLELIFLVNFKLFSSYSHLYLMK